MNAKTAALVYPHQLWLDHPAVKEASVVLLIEDPLFFTQYNFHKQKLILHRASMKEFAIQCTKSEKKVHYIESKSISHSSNIGEILKQLKIQEAIAVEPTDQWLRQRVNEGCRQSQVAIKWLKDPSFLTPVDVIENWSEGRKHFHFTDFYMMQRKRLNLLLDQNGKPLGGKWTYDTENRKRLPKDIVIPPLHSPSERESVKEAKRYVEKNFPEAPGEVADFQYPVTHRDSENWLRNFIAERLADFGDFEDAISKRETFVFHGVLTPMLNVGLLTPSQIVQAAIDQQERVSLNSLEGFVRQVIGWREFIRLIYLQTGSKQRTTNSWNMSRSLPRSFYEGTTGIVPLDHSIQRVQKYAYCHHIERLMVLGNFMLLCDIDPDEVYRWFMELFIDSYDWVMVPNVYGMSQHADGGLMTTKPYISGSAYVLKMSDYPKGDWCEVWDALYWRFVDRQRTFFEGNPRMRVMVGQLDRMGAKLDKHRQTAEKFLAHL